MTTSHSDFTLVIGQKNYSSWSMRAWLMLKFLNVRFDEVTVPLYGPESRRSVRALGGETGLVPVLIDRGTPIWDTLAIFEHLYENYPAVWPADQKERARARSYSGEIHSAFHALRGAMPFNTRARRRLSARTAEVTADIERVLAIWGACRGSPWLFGAFSAADVMFAPIATRFRTYDVRLEGPAKDYMNRLLEYPAVAEWLKLGEQETDVIPTLEIGAERGRESHAQPVET